MALEGLQCFTVFAPQLHREVITGAGDCLSVRTEGHILDLSAMALESL